VDGLPVDRLEGEVEPRGRLAVRADEELVGGEEARALNVDTAPDRPERGGVEGLARLEVAHAQVDVVEQPTPIEDHLRNRRQPSGWNSAALTRGETLA